MESSQLAERLARHIKSRHASSFFINGPPGAGKSSLVHLLVEKLPGAVAHSDVLGPYTLAPRQGFALGVKLLQSCKDAGYLDSPYPLDLDLIEACTWLLEEGYFRDGHSFLVFIDLEQGHRFDLKAMGTLFSQVRSLEGYWDHRRLRFFFLVAGYWNHPRMEDHFLDIRTSFPYTEAYNYIRWQGISSSEMEMLIAEHHPRNKQPLYGQILHELTGGHPAAAIDVLGSISSSLSLEALLKATYQAADSGKAGQELLNVWKQLPAEALRVAGDLLVQRHVTIQGNPSYLSQLESAGMVKIRHLDANCYVSFRSWYTELLTRLHADAIGVESAVTQVCLEELVPSIAGFNYEAYRLIYDIENQVRNFIAIQAQKLQEDGRHFLEGWANRPDKWNNSNFRDAYERATDWRQRSEKAGLPAAINPLSTHLDTGTLAAIIHEIASDLKSAAWRNIANAIDDLKHVRNAVMHNQLIDEKALQRLYDLQVDIYDALSDT